MGVIIQKRHYITLLWMVRRILMTGRLYQLIISECDFGNSVYGAVYIGTT